MTLYVRVCPYRCALQKAYSDGRPSERPTSGKKRDIIGQSNMLQSVYTVQGIVAFHDYEAPVNLENTQDMNSF